MYVWKRRCFLMCAMFACTNTCELNVGITLFAGTSHERPGEYCMYGNSAETSFFYARNICMYKYLRADKLCIVCMETSLKNSCFSMCAMFACTNTCQLNVGITLLVVHRRHHGARTILLHIHTHSYQKPSRQRQPNTTKNNKQKPNTPFP